MAEREIGFAQLGLASILKRETGKTEPELVLPGTRLCGGKTDSGSVCTMEIEHERSNATVSKSAKRAAPLWD
jgi:hypothetical protein